MSESYKKAMDKIKLSENAKNRIIENALNSKKKSSFVTIKRVEGLVACFFIIATSAFALNHYAQRPIPTTIPNVNNTVTPTPSGDNGAVFSESTTEQNTENTTIIEKSVKATENKIEITTSKALPQNNVEEKQKSFTENKIENKTENKIENKIEATTEIEKVTEEQTFSKSKEGKAMVASPMAEFDSIEQLQEAIGYEFAVPIYLPKDYTLSVVDTINGKLIQLIYEKDEEQITYRTQKIIDDISGDFNEYEKIETLKINNCDVTLKSNDDKYYSAIWHSEDSSYSLTSTEGIEKQEFEKLIAGIV